MNKLILDFCNRFNYSEDDVEKDLYFILKCIKKGEVNSQKYRKRLFLNRPKDYLYCANELLRELKLTKLIGPLPPYYLTHDGELCLKRKWVFKKHKLNRDVLIEMIINLFTNILKKHGI